MPGMPDHVKECDGAGPALRVVHPVACPRVIGDIALAAIPDVKPIERVVENRQPDAEQFQAYDKREAAQQFDLFGISRGSAGREGIGNEVLNKKRADGNDAAERMQTPQEEGITLACP